MNTKIFIAFGLLALATIVFARNDLYSALKREAESEEDFYGERRDNQLDSAFDLKRGLSELNPFAMTKRANCIPAGESCKYRSTSCCPFHVCINSMKGLNCVYRRSPGRK